MEIALEHSAAGLDGPDPRPVKRPHRQTKVQLLTRSHLDGRSNACKEYDRIVSGIESDLGGKDRLSTVQAALVEAFAGAAVHVANLNTRLLIGESVDLAEHSAAIGAMVRVASRIGVSRVPRDVTGDPLTYFVERAKENSDDEDIKENCEDGVLDP
jgi:hypothetical protein